MICHAAWLTTKLDMSAAKCRVAQPCSDRLTPHSAAAQKNATMPRGQQTPHAAARLRTALPSGGPSCSTEPTMCTSAVTGTNQTCLQKSVGPTHHEVLGTDIEQTHEH